MADGGDHEADLTADYNAEMIEQIARFPRVRDRAIFVGDPDDIVPDPSGRGSPPSVTGPSSTTTSRATSPASTRTSSQAAPRSAMATHEQICIVTVGGSAVGHPPPAPGYRGVPAGQGAGTRSADDHRGRARGSSRRSCPGLAGSAGGRLSVGRAGVAGGLEIRAYVPDLYRHLAVCDLAVVQGGLTTAMELTANRRPFLYFPLGHHFEQSLHVRHRLVRYRAGRAWTTRPQRPPRSPPRSRARSAAGRLPPGRDRRRRPGRRASRRPALTERGRGRWAPMRSSCRSSSSSWDASYRSSASWPFNQNWGVVPSALASRSWPSDRDDAASPVRRSRSAART